MTFDQGAIGNALLASGAPGDAFCDVTAGIGDVRRLVPEEEVPPDEEVDDAASEKEGTEEKQKGDAAGQGQGEHKEPGPKDRTNMIDHY